MYVYTTVCIFHFFMSVAETDVLRLFSEITLHQLYILLSSRNFNKTGMEEPLSHEIIGRVVAPTYFRILFVLASFPCNTILRFSPQSVSHQVLTFPSRLSGNRYFFHGLRSWWFSANSVVIFEGKNKS